MSHRERVDYVRIQSMFARGGQVYKFAGKVEDDVRTAARLRAGKRSGALRRSISSSRHTVPSGVKFQVKAYAEHALWVELGTAAGGAGNIYSARGVHFPMHLYAGGRTGIPARYVKYRNMRRRMVSGQKPKHFLARGLHDGMVQNGLS